MTSIFQVKSSKPNARMLSGALGRSYEYWEEMKKALQAEHGKLTEEWKYYSASSGWTLKVLLKQRNLFFFTPCEGYFRIAFVFGDKAVGVVADSDLPARIVQELKSAKRYAEGRGLRIEVKKQAEIKTVITLAAIKVRN
jgi:hypothetical protein